MSDFRRPASSPAGSLIEGAAPADTLLTVYSCSRIGRVANPPSFSLGAWFRSALRR